MKSPHSRLGTPKAAIMHRWYPLRFEPLFRRYLWGGRRLHSVLGKKIGEGADYAESWEVVDRGPDQSLVTNGPLAGQPLHCLVKSHGPELFGRHPPQERFPLLLKFLDCNRDLSVQVHPDDRQAARLNPPDLGKTEAWVVLHADPGSRIYAGLAAGIERQELAARILAGQTASCLHSFPARVGDCVFVPAGTVHALGAGLIVAEIQQASDTTFRLYDWDRLGADGKPRPLHVEQALEVIDYRAGPVQPVQPEWIEGGERLVACDQFVLERRRLDRSQRLGGDERFHLLAVVDGSIALSAPYCGQALGRGDVALLPAAAGPIALVPQQPATLLEVFLP